MNRLLNRVSTLLLMLLATIPMAHLVICGYSLDVDRRLPLFLTVAVLLCWLMFSFLPYRLPGLLLSGGLAFLFIRGRREILAEQFTDILDRISATYYDRFTSGAYELVFESGDHTEAMLIFGFIFTALLGMALSSREDRVFLSLLVSVPILLLCLLVYGLIPGWIMLCLTLFIVMLICTGRINRPEGSLGRSFFVLFLPVALILGVLLIFKGPDKYDYTQQDLSFVKQIQAFTGKLRTMISSDADAPPQVNERSPVVSDSEGQFESQQNQWSGSGSTLDASAPSSLAELNETLMYVTAEQSGRIYLRHNSYGAYTGKGWADAPVYPGTALPSFSAKAVAASSNAVSEKLSIRLAAADASFSMSHITQTWHIPRTRASAAVKMNILCPI